MLAEFIGLVPPANESDRKTHPARSDSDGTLPERTCQLLGTDRPISKLQVVEQFLQSKGNAVQLIITIRR